MNKQLYIVFKKNKDNNNYSFYNIFVTPIGDEIQLEDDSTEGFSFCTGIVTSSKDNVLKNIIGNDSDKITFSTSILKDDGHDEYFSILIDDKQLSNMISIFSMDESLETGLLDFLEVLYKRCDGMDNIEINKETMSNSIFSEVTFIPDRDDIEARSPEYLRNIIGLIDYRSMYDENMRSIEHLAQSLGTYAHEISSEDDEDMEEHSISDIDAEEVIKEIKKKVVAQDSAVETIVNNIYTNQKTIESGDADLVKTMKANILLDGPTGTGKTLIVNCVADQLHLPIAIRAVTDITIAGYRGADLTGILVSLLEASDGNLELAQKGIVVFDEFDKLCSKGERPIELRNALQDELLSYIGGGSHEIDFRGRKINFDTSKITFIGLGAFTDLRERKIKESNSTPIGFTSPDLQNKRTYTISPKDYVKEGLHKELVGRFGLFFSTDHLTHEKLVLILKTSSLSPILNLKKLCKSCFDVDLIYDDSILDIIADYALEEGTGARGLENVVQSLKNIILGDMISSRVDRIVITEELLKKSRNFMVRGY